MKKAWTIPLIVMLSLLFLANSGSALTEISACQTLSTANEIYVMNTSINSLGDCFNTTANNITLDCNGFSSHGVGGDSTEFMRNNNRDYLTMKNCNISNYSYAYYAENSDFTLLQNNNMTVCTIACIGILYRSADNILEYNNVVNVEINSGSNRTIVRYNNIINRILISGDGATNGINNTQIYGNSIGFLHISSNSFANYLNITNNNITISSASGGYALRFYSWGSNYTTIANNNIVGIVTLTNNFYNVINSNNITNHPDFNDYVLTTVGGGANNITNNRIKQTRANSAINFDTASNLFYNNLLNSTTSVTCGVYDGMNTTRQVGTRIFGNGTEIGGNFWTNPYGTGYSDICDDANTDGFCDNAYSICSGSAYDYLPLSNEYLLILTGNVTFNILDSSIENHINNVNVTCNNSYSEIGNSPIIHEFDYGDYNCTFMNSSYYSNESIFTVDTANEEVNITLTLKTGNVTFNILDSSTENHIDDVNISCNNSYNEVGNSPIIHEFNFGDYNCSFTNTSYYGNESVFTVNDINEEVNVTLTLKTGNVTFNILDDTSGDHINNVNVTCNNSYSEIGNSPIIHEFNFGDYNCSFTNALYEDNESVFTVNDINEEVNVTLTFIQERIIDPDSITGRLVLSTGFGIMGFFSVIGLLYVGQTWSDPKTLVKAMVGVLIVILMLVSVWQGLVL